MNNNDDPENKDEESTVSQITGAIATVFGHWPVAVTKNLSKVAGYLLIIPKTILDNWASERKAVSDARIQITKASGKALAKGVEKSIETDTNLISLAKEAHTNKILKQQTNIAKIVEIAIDETEAKQIATRATKVLEDTASVAEEVLEISEDWLNSFESEAINMSSEHMQILFGKILAGEIKKPSSFSIRTLKLMGQLDTDTASLFQRLCSLTCTSYNFYINNIQSTLKIEDSRVIYVDTLTDEHGLSSFGISYTDLTELAEYGLIASDFNSYMTYGGGIFHTGHFVSSPIDYVDKTYNIVSKEEKPEFTADVVRFYGVQLSKAGKELLKIVEKKENEKYTAALKMLLDKRGLALQTVEEWAGE
jgi:hypothetical protein